MNKPYNKPKQKPTRKITQKPRNPDQTQDLTDTRTPDRMHSAPKEGSPAKKPCANIGVSETANEESPAEMIHVADGGGAGGTGNVVTLRAVPLYLIAPVLSREIHTYKGAVSQVVIRRTGQHRYLITLLTRPAVTPSDAGVTDAD